MSGYKRVNFYELCRLCATNQQKEKTHIFQEEGRKIQLQNKIQSCLSLKVCENDFLPKVVCSRCLRTLEECSAFRKECYTSETMLSSYFNNFRYTEDFKKSGKVYIKDISPKVVATTEPTVQTSTSIVNTISNNNNIANSNSGCNVNVVSNVNSNVPQESVPYYTLHLPSVIPQTQEGKHMKDTKIIAQPQLVYNLNAIKAVVPNITKTNLNETLGNVAINSNGEIITIAPLVDMDTLFTQNVIQKPQKKIHKKYKITDNSTKSLEDSNVIKIDLTHPEADLKRDAYDKIKMQQNKVSYTIKVNDTPKGAFVLNPLEMNNTADINRTTNANFNTNQSILLNSNMTRSTVSNVNTNRLPKTYSSFNNINLTNSVPSSNINIPIANINPTSDAISNLNPEPPPTLNVSSTLNVSVSNFNSVQNMHYSISNPKQDNLPVENNVNITSSDTVVLTNMFSTTNASITTNNQTTCSVLRNGTTSSLLNPIPTQNLNFSNLNPTPNFSTTTTNINNVQPPAPPNNQTSNFNSSSMDPLTKQDNNAIIKRHSCDICCKTFKRREHLYQHVKLHTGFRPFKCESCNKSFMRKEHLLRHMTSHSGQKNFTCSICEKSFSRNDNLLKHKKIHNKQNSFTCEVCQKQFVMEHYYLAHKHAHDNDKCNVNPVWGLLKAI